jgi:hypothetical protein
MLSPSAAPRWITNTKRRSDTTEANAMRGAIIIAPTPAPVHQMNFRRVSMALSPLKIG